MSGEPHWVTLALILFGVLFIVALNIASNGGLRPIRVRRRYRLTCPSATDSFQGQVVECTVLEDEGRAIRDVARCSAFDPGETPSCSKACIAYLNMLGERRPAALNGE